MQGLIFNILLSAISTAVAGYMQINGIGSVDLVAAIAAVGGGNGIAAVKRGADMRKASKMEAETKRAYVAQTEVHPPQ